MQVRFVIVAGRTPAHLLVQCEPGSTWADVVVAASDTNLDVAAYVDGSPLAPDDLVGQPPLLHGAVITVDSQLRRERSFPLILQVASGRAAGAVHPLRPGRLTLGRDSGSDLVVPDPEASRFHAELEVSAAGDVTLRDLASTNGTVVDGEPVGSTPVPIRHGAQLRLGGTWYRFFDQRKPPHPTAARADGQGRLVVNIPPRLDPPPGSLEITLPDDASSEQTRDVFSWARVLAPAVLAAVLAVVYGTRLLVLSLITPLAGLVGVLVESARSRRLRRLAAGEAQRRRARVDVEIRRALAAELAWRQRRSPDAAELLAMANRRLPGLWQRQPTDSDFGLIRVGTTDLSSHAVVRGADREAQPPIIQAAPSTISLIDHAVIGIAGPQHAAESLARFITAQLAILHAPADLTIAVHHNDSLRPAWSWTRWLPHFVTGPATVTIVDGRPLPELSQGQSAVCIAEHAAALPRRCTAIVECVSDSSGTVTTGESPGSRIVPDLVDLHWAEGCARALAPLRTVGPQASREPPDVVWLADLLDLDPVDLDAVILRWRRADRAPRAVLGATATGAYSIDLRSDGPHVLIAGTTGSGKSELLRTLVASLAVGCPPDELAFVLVDYKGGAAFGDCARLPHTTGLLTDLDGELTARALSGLGAELRRRERMLAGAGVSDIDEYERKAKEDDLQPCARLVIIVDEFATLVDDLPDFISGLVSIARRGRSLGIHLVLATQRPAGVVTADIRANVGLRIALRVTETGESVDVIGVPDAASLRHAGRAIARAPDGALTHFQGARVGGSIARERVRAWVLPADEWDIDEPDDGRSLALTGLAEVLEAAAARLGIRRLPRSWASPLPIRVSTDDLFTGGGFLLGLGLVDAPERQCHETLSIDLSAGSAWIVAGGPGSGKTTFVRTAATQLVRCLDVADAHLYVIDTTGDLRDLAGLPHCGALVPGTERRRVARLLDRLVYEIGRRRAQGIRHPFLVLAIDGWSAFTELAEGLHHGRPLQALARLLRDGPAAGLTVLLTGDRDLLTARIAAHVAHRIVLKLADPTDYVTAGLTPRALPSDPPPGRGVLASTGQAVQIALAPGRPTDWATPARDGPNAARPGPFRVDAIPEVVTMDDVGARVDSHDRRGALWVPLGLGGDEAEAIGVDLAAHVLLVAGSRRSGRTTALHAIECWLTDHGVRVVRIRPDTSLDAMEIDGRTVFLVDDAEEILHTPLDDALLRRTRSEDPCGVVIAGLPESLARTYTGIAARARRDGAILLLGPSSPADLDLTGARIDKDHNPPPGRGILLLDGQQTEVQIPNPSGQERSYATANRHQGRN